ncbi:FxsA family protein [Embleya hyalina]|uniref:Membrane protein n=1 Tax=Embleya hyalina TaxID=516124 RepID=A0A401YU74_9ACTN|nr:FxsA family protein [Embleya hyalina]GCD98173.1 membrane protein [Embleya hyalina]
MSTPLRRAVKLLPIVALPLAEIYVITLVGGAIGAGETFLLILAGIAVGSLVIRYEGRRVLNRLRALGERAQREGGSDPAVIAAQGKEATKAAADAGVVILGGVLLIIPGFISDALGLLCVLPFTRPLVRRLIGTVVAAKVAGSTRLSGMTREARIHRPDGKIIQGEVIDPDPRRDDEPPPPPPRPLP